MKNMMRLTQSMYGEMRTVEMDMPRQFAPNNFFPITVEMFEKDEPTLEELFPNETARNVIVDKVKELKASNQLIEAIKTTRSFTGWTLLVAKQFVDALVI